MLWIDFTLFVRFFDTSSYYVATIPKSRFEFFAFNFLVSWVFIGHLNRYPPLPYSTCAMLYCNGELGYDIVKTHSLCTVLQSENEAMHSAHFFLSVRWVELARNGSPDQLGSKLLMMSIPQASHYL